MQGGTTGVHFKAGVNPELQGFGMALQKSFVDVLEKVKKEPQAAGLAPELDKVDEKDVKLFRCA